LKKININCDMGEGTGNDAAIMPYINAVNIACGFHAGDETTMEQTVQLALQYNVAIGAHPSFFDRENFGRTQMKLPAHEIYDTVTKQLSVFDKIITRMGATMNHVKPHGALYNMSAKDIVLANIIAKAVSDFNPSLILVGLSGSHSIDEARAAGLKTANEAFADRTYQDDGSLTPRSQPGALIETVEKVVAQVEQLIQEGTVMTVSGKIIPVAAETICIHGDGKQASEFVKAIYNQIIINK
jgi:5-oxoprolinase (ATP-hydrolysing) subunit A